MESQWEIGTNLYRNRSKLSGHCVYVVQSGGDVQSSMFNCLTDDKVYFIFFSNNICFTTIFSFVEKKRILIS